MNARMLIKSLVTLMAATIVVVTYNNCSPQHQLGSGNFSSGLKYWTCADNLDDVSLFSRTFSPFLQNTCVACHSGGGPGPGAFASSGPQLAFDSFNLLGFSRIHDQAITPHGGGPAGPQFKPEVDLLAAKYVDGLATIQECKNNGTGEIQQEQDDPTRIRFKSKAISPVKGQVSVMSWDIATETYPTTGFVASDFAGMKLEADVQLFEKPGIISYVVSNPRLVTNMGDVHIESLLYKVNGIPTPAQRSFYLVIKDIRAWNASHPDFNKPDPDASTTVNEYQYQARLISGGALVMVGDVHTTDVLSVSIGKLQRVTLPPPDLGPKISFGATSASVNEAYTIVTVPLVLDKSSTQITSAEITFGPNTTIKDECCRTTMNDDGKPIQVRHFDRDIQDFDLDPNIKINRRVAFDTGGVRGRYLVQFLAGETSQTIQIKVVGDNRDEPNEILHLQVNPGRLNGLQPNTTNQDYQLTIVDDDNPYTGTADKYSNLLTDGGLLADQCLRCHNSVLFRGGYDITNWEDMITRRILVPGDPNQGTMYKRMNEIISGFLPMPQTGLLDPTDRARVAGWISGGAPNN